jgi:Tetracyclin repressor-like, C-terminal domain
LSSPDGSAGVTATRPERTPTHSFALQEKTIPFETPEESAEMAATTVGEMGTEYPYLAQVVVELGKSGYDYAEEFEFGLDLILHGLERLLGP